MCVCSESILIMCRFFFCISQTKYLCILFRYIFKVARRFLFCLIDSAADALIGQTKEYLAAARCGNTLLSCAHTLLLLLPRAVFRHSQPPPSPPSPSPRHSITANSIMYTYYIIIIIIILLEVLPPPHCCLQVRRSRVFEG